VPAADRDAATDFVRNAPAIFDEVAARPAWSREPDPKRPGEYVDGAYQGYAPDLVIHTDGALCGSWDRGAKVMLDPNREGGRAVAPAA